METAFTEKEWYDNFHISRSTFDDIVREVQDEIVQKDTPMHKAVSPRKRTAITLYSMSSTAEYRTIADLFGVSMSFICLCIRDVCKAMTKNLKNDFLKVPKGEDLREVMRLYKDKSGFPSCAVAIDGTHIPTQASLENCTDYINRKSYHSTVMQALVDSKYFFKMSSLVDQAVSMMPKCFPTQSFIIMDAMGNFLIPASKNKYSVLI